MIRLIEERYSFSSPDLIPPLLRGYEKSRPAAGNFGVSRVCAKQNPLILDRNCSLSGFRPEDLGFELVEVFWQRQWEQNARGGKNVYILWFRFSAPEFARTGDEFRLSRNSLLPAINEIRTKYFWDLAVYKNEYYQDGEAVPGQHSISVACLGRKPCLADDGTPLTVWAERDAENRPVVEKGRKPVLPKAYLRILDGNIGLYES